MKFLVISDTHRSLERAEKVIAAAKDLTHIVHLGDMSADAAALSRMTKREIISVNGNCDFDFSDGNYRIITTECGNILAVHGHREHVKSGLLGLYCRAVELGCAAAFFGHTHVAGISGQNGVTLVNPGSLTYPAHGADPSYAVVCTRPDGISASIFYVDSDGAAFESQRYFI
jgi:putative phosphoesterase